MLAFRCSAKGTDNVWREWSHCGWSHRSQWPEQGTPTESHILQQHPPPLSSYLKRWVRGVEAGKQHASLPIMFQRELHEGHLQNQQMLDQDLLFSFSSGDFQLFSYKKLLLEVMTTHANPFKPHNIKAFYLSSTEDPITPSCSETTFDVLDQTLSTETRCSQHLGCLH